MTSRFEQHQESIGRIAAGLAESSGKQPEPQTDDERIDAMIARADADPEFDRSLTPEQRITMGFRARNVLKARLLLGDNNQGNGDQK